MEKYKCPKCGMEYDKPGKCTMDGAELVEAGDDKSPSTPKHSHHDHHAMMVKDFKKRFFVSVVLTIPILLLSPLIQKFAGFTIAFAGDKYLLFILATFIFFYGGWPFLKGLFTELKNKLPGMMTLIALAITVAFVYSSAVVFGLKGKFFFWELVTLIDIMLLGHWIEMRSVMGASKALEALAKLMPSEAHLIKSNGKTIETPISKLIKGDVILVKPGEKIPSDGIIIKGESNINESMLTGESKPVSKKKGDKVIGGSVNGEGAIHIKVTNTGEKSYLSQVIRLVREAQESKSKTQDLANTAAKWLTIISISIGSITFVAWLLFKETLTFAIERMVTVMVITCPHALGLAVPLVVAVSTSLAAKNGLLIRNRASFEKARKIDAIVFDKTGTLTKGEFGVTDIIPLGNYKEDEVLLYAASLEANSENPIAKGVIKKAKEKKIRLIKVEKFLNLPGKGIQGLINNKQIRVVGPNYLKENRIKIENKKVDELSKQGKTTVYVLLENKLIGAVALADLIRDESKEAIKNLKSMGIKCMMLTGDNKQVAQWVAKELELDDFFAEVLPHEKSKNIKKIQKKGLRVAMVGDGVNDAPALTQADVGIAIGAGTDVAIESADVILVSNDPRDVVSVIGLAKATYGKMKQNLLWATGYNIFAIPLAAGILYKYDILLSPAMGAVFMSLSTVIVAVNARFLSIKRQK
ncbi:copper-translocating P-type ATPase [Candidatus Woesearchaeota archaeon]|nr:copper-translocating P-type ATPase [Candidatus Woesearchaeota archaeon]